MGAASWAVGSFLQGPNQKDAHVYAWTSLAFQFGLLALIQIQTRTRATGTGRVARAFLVGEHVLVACAIVSTLNDILLPSIHGSIVWGLFDACWPLSMMGMFGIAVRIAIARRWQGPARFWPLVAESWALVCVPASGVLADRAAGAVSGTHLLIGYTTLGAILALRPHLATGRR